MKKGLVLLSPEPDWAEKAFQELAPGAHAIVVGNSLTGIEARKAGFEVRDTILVLSPRGARTAFLFRKPIEESTTTAQVLATGTGALNIDPCRVTTADKLGGDSEKRCTFQGKEGWNRPWMNDSKAQEAYAQRARENVAKAEQLGRWPSNLVLVHGPGCRKAGTKRIQGNPKWPAGESSTVLYGHCHRRPEGGHADEDGKETITLYECQDDCPSKQLNTQSGILKSGKVEPHHMRNNSTQPSRGGFEGGFKDYPLSGYGDEGGASRFFPQFMNEDELLAWLETLVGVNQRRDSRDRSRVLV